MDHSFFWIDENRMHEFLPALAMFPWSEHHSGADFETVKVGRGNSVHLCLELFFLSSSVCDVTV